MKKQILILMLALFVSSASVYGQAIKGSDPQPVDCPNDALNPIAGVPYTYSADATPIGGVDRWFATQSTSFINGGAFAATVLGAPGPFISAATNYDNTVAVTTAATTETVITWTNEAIAAASVDPLDAPVLFVGLHYTATAPNCADNLKVYPIRPVNAFVVDIMNMTPGATQAPMGYGVPANQCVDNVWSATFNTGTLEMEYDFGINYLYYEVIAANFSAGYTAHLRLTGLLADQTAIVEWGYAIDSYPNQAGGIYNGTTPAVPIDVDAILITTNVLNTEEGVSFYVRVTINNNNYETLAAQPIDLAVNGEIPMVAPLNSIFSVLNDDCTTLSDYADIASQNVLPRPTVTPNTPGGFIPQVTP